jgi:hypothetical protein
MGKLGVYVPRAGMAAPEVAAHHHLAFEINDPKRFNPAMGGMMDLVAELRDQQPRQVVISTEALSWTALDPGRIGRFRGPLLELGYELIWIVYVRTFPDWAESAYTQLAKTLSVTRPFAEWVRDATKPLVLGMEPHRVPDGIRSTGDSLQLRSYSMALPDLIGDFMDVLGVGGHFPSAQISGQRVNLRPQVLKMEFLRRAAIRAAAIRKPGVRQAFVQKALRLLPGVPPSPPYRGLSQSLALSLLEATRPQYEDLLAKYRPDLHFDIFFPLAENYRELHFDNYDCPRKDRIDLEGLLTQLGA